MNSAIKRTGQQDRLENFDEVSTDPQSVVRRPEECASIASFSVKKQVKQRRSDRNAVRGAVEVPVILRLALVTAIYVAASAIDLAITSVDGGLSS